jgi:two-component sensor histidine kinase
LVYPDIDYRREVIERWKPALENARRSGEAVNTGTYRITCRDGSELVCELYVACLADRFVVTFNDITERQKAEEQVRQSLREKELLLREVYHRTKNNMNVITALLSLRSENSRDPAVIQTFKDIEYRIKAMALVHQKLYQSLDLSRIDMGEYLSDLSSLLVKTAPGSMGRIALEFDMIPLLVPIDVAIPLGLIVTELFSNVVKHALRKNGEVRVRLGLSRLGTGDIELTFSDDGVGVPPGFDFRTGRTLGLQTVIMLVEHQLRGRVEFEGGHGVSCRVRIPAPPDPDGTRPRRSLAPSCWSRTRPSSPWT